MPECCTPENLRIITPEEAGVVPNDGVVIKRCVVCGCRHFEASIEPFHLGVTGTSLR